MAEDSTETKYDPADIVVAAASQEPGTARLAYDQLVLDRAYELVKAKRQEVAQTFGRTGYFGLPGQQGVEQGDEVDSGGEMGSDDSSETGDEGSGDEPAD